MRAIIVGEYHLPYGFFDGGVGSDAPARERALEYPPLLPLKAFPFDGTVWHNVQLEFGNEKMRLSLSPSVDGREERGWMYGMWNVGPLIPKMRAKREPRGGDSTIVSARTLSSLKKVKGEK